MINFTKVSKNAIYQAVNTDKVKVSVGGKSTDYFAPSVNASFELESGKEQAFFNICDDPEQVNTKAVKEGHTQNKISVGDGKVKSVFTSNDDSLKIERVFYQKPTEAPRYRLAYSPGVSFYYQGELTAEEIAMGVVRPDDVVGSYAVYCNKQGHYKDLAGNTKVNYGCGKLGHLYAPYWTDAEGRKIKGIQRIVDNYLIFDLPEQEWIDSAVLPITLDPSLGYTTVGASIYLLSNYSLAYGVPIGSAAGGTITNVSAYLKNNTALFETLKLGAYTSNGTSEPAYSIATPGSISVSYLSTLTVKTVSYSGVISSTDTYIFPGIFGNGTSYSYLSFDMSPPTNGFYCTGSSWYSTWPVNSDSPYAAKFSVYLTYEAAANNIHLFAGAAQATRILQ